MAGAQRFDLRKVGQPRQELCCSAAVQQWIGFASQTGRGGVEVRGLETGVHCLDEPHAAEQKARSHQQRKTDPDLRHHQGVPEARSHVRHSGPCRVECRCEPEQNRGGDGNREHKGKDAPIRIQVDRERILVARRQRDSRENGGIAQPNRHVRRGQPRNPAQHAENRAFGDQLPDQAAIRRSDGQTDLDLPPSSHRAREKKVRDVRTGDHQHQANREAHRHDERHELLQIDERRRVGDADSRGPCLSFADARAGRLIAAAACAGNTWGFRRP